MNNTQQVEETGAGDARRDQDVEPYVYIGDLNVEYGGTWFDLSEWENGYVDAVRVTDLDSACGFDGAILIEKISIIVDPKYFKESAVCCGFELSEVDLESVNGRLRMADALMTYGHYDPANEYYEPLNEVIQTEENFPMEFDGWKATKRVHSENLEGYIKSKYLS